MAVLVASEGLTQTMNNLGEFYVAFVGISSRLHSKLFQQNISSPCDLTIILKTMTTVSAFNV